MSVRAVLFDWGGTLTPWHGDIDHYREWSVYVEAAGLDAVEDSTAKIIDSAHRAWGRSRTEHTSTTVEGILRDAGVDVDHVDHASGLRAHLEFWDRHTYTDPLVQPLWEWLRENDIRVGVLSNTIWSREHHRGIFERDGVLHLIDGDVYSSEIPWSKPHPEAFRAAARSVGVDPTECVYVGDRPFEDVFGSQQVGMRAVLVPHSDIPPSQQVDTDATPDGVAHVLSDVADLVRGWRD